MQLEGSLRLIRSNTYSLNSSGLSEIWCKCDCHYVS